MPITCRYRVLLNGFPYRAALRHRHRRRRVPPGALIRLPIRARSRRRHAPPHRTATRPRVTGRGDRPPAPRSGRRAPCHRSPHPSSSTPTHHPLRSEREAPVGKGKERGRKKTETGCLRWHEQELRRHRAIPRRRQRTVRLGLAVRRPRRARARALAGLAAGLAARLRPRRVPGLDRHPARAAAPGCARGLDLARHRRRVRRGGDDRDAPRAHPANAVKGPPQNRTAAQSTSAFTGPSSPIPSPRAPSRMSVASGATRCRPISAPPDIHRAR